MFARHHEGGTGIIGGVTVVLLAISTGATAVHGAQLAAIREVLQERTGYVCLSIDTGNLGTPATREDHLKSSQARVDPSASVMASLKRPGVTLFPSSQCVRTDREWDIVHRGTGKPGTLVGVGRLEWISTRRARVVVFTYAGFLSDTFTQLEIEQQRGTWTVVSSKIILQA